MSALPAGLTETIEHFRRGCEAQQKTVAPDVVEKLIARFAPSYERYSEGWPRVSLKLLTLAGMAGRMAALHANLGGSSTVEWVHARKALLDVQQESKTRYIGRYFTDVDLAD